jgi:fumarate hydratase subunit alpha
MREIEAKVITENIRKLCIEANVYLPKDLKDSLVKSLGTESNQLAKSLLKDICNNYTIAENDKLPVCQDTGMAVVFAEIGQDVHIINGDFTEAVNKGVHEGYIDGYLRKSVVGDPLRRINTDDNTPAVIHTEIVKGDKIKLVVSPKGFGSENMSKIKMFNPSADEDDIINFILDCVSEAGSNPCPPIIIGIGIGGDFELCAELSKKALCRDISMRNHDRYYSDLEEKILDKINCLDIGPQGLGGKTTALAVNIETYPTHIAGLPVAVNFGCHVTRHKTIIL